MAVMPQQRSAAMQLVLSVLGVALVGIYNLESAAKNVNENLYLIQGAWLVAGCAVAFAVVVVGHSRLGALSYIFLGGALGLLVAVMLVGEVRGGARRWLDLGFYTFQPSEPTKVVVILAVAYYFSRRLRRDGYDLRSLFRPLNLTRPLAVLAAVLLLWNQPWFGDPGGALAQALGPSLGDVVRVPLRGFVAGLVLLIAGGISFWRLRRTTPSTGPLSAVEGRMRRLAWLGVVLALGLGVAFVFGLGPFFLDPWAWWKASTIERGAAELQPGLGPRITFAAIALLYLAASLGKTMSEGMGWHSWVAPIDLILVPAALIIVEPDLGTGMIVVLVGAAMVVYVGLKAWSYMIAIGMGLLTAVIGWVALLKPYQRQRIRTFMDPESDIQGSGWNAMQSLIAIGSGGFFGKGHGEGTQTQLEFLPERQTDFAFSVWAEEHGLVGIALLMGLYTSLMWAGLRIAERADDAHGSLLAYGCVALVFWHTVINMAMVMGVAPVVGLTLPFFSYGGSSLITFMVAVGLMLSVAYRR